MERPNRRLVLGATTGALGALAGCNRIRRFLGSNTDDRNTTTASTTADESTSEPVDRADFPRRIHVENQTDAAVYITIAVTGPATTYSRTRQLAPGATGIFRDVVPGAGTYEVSIETTEGVTATQQWAVSPTLSDLTATISRTGIEFSQSAFCNPTCPPLSTEGTSTELPYYGTAADNPLYYGATLAIENVSGGTRDVHAEIHRDDTTLLDYRYTVPDGLTITFPGIHVSENYTVTVATDAATSTHTWPITKERYLTATLTENAVDIGCGGSTASIHLVNEDDTAHEVIVRARPADGVDGAEEILFTETYEVAARAETLETGVFTGSGHYLLDVTLATGETTTYDWWLCPPRGPTEIRITASGELSVIQLIPPE